MGSLFDLAAELSQYDEAPERTLTVLPGATLAWKPPHTNRIDTIDSPNASNNQEGDSVLSLLDETLLTIYATRQPQPPSPSRRAPALVSLRSAPQLLLPSRKDERDQRPRSTAPPAAAPVSTPLQSVFAQSLALPSVAPTTRPIPPPPSVPPPASFRASASAKESPTFAEDPDVTARKTLREIQEELEQLPRDAMASPKRLHRFQRSLSDKYLQDRLSKLPPTPFVQLARRKAQQKIEQLSDKLLPVQPKATPAVPTFPTSKPPGIFPPDQHEMLVKLALIPDSHIAKLSATQQQTVQFAKRYDKILRLSSDELRKLPVSQAQLLQQLQQQRKH